MPRRKSAVVVPIKHQHETHKFTRIEVDRMTLAAFRPAAIARGTNSERIARDILTTVAVEPTLIAAIAATMPTDLYECSQRSLRADCGC